MEVVGRRRALGVLGVGVHPMAHDATNFLNAPTSR